MANFTSFAIEAIIANVATFVALVSRELKLVLEPHKDGIRRLYILSVGDYEITRFLYNEVKGQLFMDGNLLFRKEHDEDFIYKELQKKLDRMFRPSGESAWMEAISEELPDKENSTDEEIFLAIKIGISKNVKMKREKPLIIRWLNAYGGHDISYDKMLEYELFDRNSEVSGEAILLGIGGTGSTENCDVGLIFDSSDVREWYITDCYSEWDEDNNLVPLRGKDEHNICKNEEHFINRYFEWDIQTHSEVFLSKNRVVRKIFLNADADLDTKAQILMLAAEYKLPVIEQSKSKDFLSDEVHLLLENELEPVVTNIKCDDVAEDVDEDDINWF